MAALDSRGTPDPPAALAPETLASLRGAFAARLRAEPVDEAVLTDVLRAAAAEAIVAGVRPEQLLVLLKRIVDEIERVEGRAVRLSLDERRRLRESVVTTSLRAYFGS